MKADASCTHTLEKYGEARPYDECQRQHAYTEIGKGLLLFLT